MRQVIEVWVKSGVIVEGRSLERKEPADAGGLSLRQPRPGRCAVVKTNCAGLRRLRAQWPSIDGAVRSLPGAPLGAPEGRDCATAHPIDGRADCGANGLRRTAQTRDVTAMAFFSNERGPARLDKPASRTWADETPSWLAGRAALDEADALAIELERKWGCGRLRLLVSPELRARFDAQRWKLRKRNGTAGSRTWCARPAAWRRPGARSTPPPKPPAPRRYRRRCGSSACRRPRGRDHALPRRGAPRRRRSALRRDLHALRHRRA